LKDETFVSSFRHCCCLDVVVAVIVLLVWFMFRILLIFYTKI